MAPPVIAKLDSRAHGVGSPVNLRGPHSPFLKPNALGSSAKSPGNKLQMLERKPRPSTAAVPLGSTAALAALMASTNAGHRPSVDVSPSFHERPESAGAIGSPHHLRRRTTAVVAPIAVQKNAFDIVADDEPAMSSPTSVIAPVGRRCAGCSTLAAEMCMRCLSHFRMQDGAAYKKQIIRSVEMLFAKATTRAFATMSFVVMQWLFGIWKETTRCNKQRRVLVARVLRRQQLRQRMTDWRVFIYERRIIGAMLFAENQQQETLEKAGEIAQLHGDVFEMHASAQVQGDIHDDALEKLRQVCASQQQSIQSKNQELLLLRRELQELKDRVVLLESQVIDPKELERIRTENVEYKKMAFQLVAGVFQSLETQLDQLATSEGRQNLAQMFSKDVLQSLDKPENQAFYNPLVEMDVIAAAAANQQQSQETVSFFTTYDASVDRADKIMMQWANGLLQRHAPDWFPMPRMVNFHSSLSDGRILVGLTKVLHSAMCKSRPKRAAATGGGAGAGGNSNSSAASKLEATSVLRENGEDLTDIAMERYVEHMRKEDASSEKRLELMINTIGQALWLPVGLINAKDVLAGDAEFNFATMCYLFTTSSPSLDESFYALCNDLRLQVSSAKAKWRELRDGNTQTPGSTVNVLSSSGAGNSNNNNAEDTSMSMKLKLALTQTMELKRKIELEDQKAREGHLLWWKSARIVMRKCFLSYARLARGKAGILTQLEASSDPNEALAKIPKHKLLDLALPFEDFAWEMKLLQSYLTTIYCDLARIYRGYATRHGAAGGGNEMMSLGDFLEMLTECRILDTGGASSGGVAGGRSSGAASLTAADVQQGIMKKIDPKMVRWSSNQLWCVRGATVNDDYC